MIQTMLQLFACMFIYAGGSITGFGIILIILTVGAILLAGICWQLIDMWIKRTRGRNWPTVSAVVDIVSVALMEDDSLIPRFNAATNSPYYLATLTYIYCNPEQQMGEYRRRFGNEDDAKAWANSYKSETVKIHVDPRDPTRSVLREEDL